MITIQRVNYHDSEQASALLYLLNEYAKDPMGGGKPLMPEVEQALIHRLQSVQGAVSLLALVGDKPVGLLNAFEGFSTFAAKPLLNIHDLAVLNEFRGHGIAKQLLQACEEIALEKNCCKLTLEVLAGNESAKRRYRSSGFVRYRLDDKYGAAEFWEKVL